MVGVYKSDETKIGSIEIGRDGNGTDEGYVNEITPLQPEFKACALVNLNVEMSKRLTI